MTRYLAARLAQVPFTLLIISAIVFVAIRMTGDPVTLYLPLDAPEAQRAAMRMELGLDRPLPVQYLNFLGRAVRGDLGYSLEYNEPAISVAFEHLPYTAALGATAFAIASVVGGGLGLCAVAARRTWLDRMILGQTFVAQAFPEFWVALLAIFVFSVTFGWLPTSGAGDWRHLILPAVAASWVISPRIALLLRASLLATYGEDYIRTARAKGLADRVILLKHVMRNGVAPLLAYMSLLLGRLMGGVVITETIFGWPGWGSLALQATFQRDMGVVQTLTLLFALAMILFNLAADLFAVAIDPRMRM